ncbi:MAG: signal recognition particle-docking protein FtsY [Actinomycetota bacterium]|mgnify:CR=1 FL=1
MIPILIGVVVVVVVLGVAGFMRGRRRVPVRRDAPTVVTRRTGGLGDLLTAAFGSGVGEHTWTALEEALLASDVGVASAAALVDATRARGVKTAGEARQALRTEMIAAFGSTDRTLRLEGNPAVVVVVGVNGSGKTTTIAKLAALLVARGRRVLLGAADTFRAAAADQLRVWGDRIGVDVVSGGAGSDPASVAHDALAAARARGRDVLIVDTAGRLHDKHNLMDELRKIVRVLGRDNPDPAEVLLVLDATTGQNGLAQARAFSAAVGVTGIVIAKLDGTARGGIALAVERELGVPIKLVGIGEGSGDLRDFEPGEFVDSLLEGS